MKRVLICNDVYDEAQKVANRICGLMQSGVRYRDIVVAVCDYDDTVQIYAETFAGFGIPVNTDIGGSLMDFSQTKLIRDTLLNAPWVDRHPIRGNTAQKISCEIKSMAQISQTLAPDALSPDVSAEIGGVLDVIERILGAQKITLTEFTNMFCSLCTAKKVSRVPYGADRVLLVSAHEFEPVFVKHLFITGASAGAFPLATPDTDIITEQDIKNLAILVEPTASMQNRRAWRRAQNVMMCATEGLTISFAETNIGGERVFVTPLASGGAPDIDTEIYGKKYAETVVLRAVGEGFRDIESAKFIGSLKCAGSIADIKIPRPNAEMPPITVAQELFWGGDGCDPRRVFGVASTPHPAHATMRVTAVENFAKCPYYHFVTNGLGLKRRDVVGRIGANVIGTIFHNFAEKYLRGAGSADEIIRGLIDPKFPKTLKMLITKQSKLIAEYFDKTTGENDFKPKLFEHKIEHEIGGVTVRGVIDRVDVDGAGRKIVIDYKSGGAGVVRLQVPLYIAFIGASGGYYLNLRDFSKKAVDGEEGAGAIKSAEQIIAEIKTGNVTQASAHKSICEYCPVGAVCGGRK